VDFSTAIEFASVRYPYLGAANALHGNWCKVTLRLNYYATFILMPKNFFGRVVAILVGHLSCSSLDVCVGPMEMQQPGSPGSPVGS
jgi:hypothetical protein